MDGTQADNSPDEYGLRYLFRHLAVGSARRGSALLVSNIRIRLILRVHLNLDSLSLATSILGKGNLCSRDTGCRHPQEGRRAEMVDVMEESVEPERKTC